MAKKYTSRKTQPKVGETHSIEFYSYPDSEAVHVKMLTPIKGGFSVFDAEMSEAKASQLFSEAKQAFKYPPRAKDLVRKDGTVWKSRVRFSTQFTF